MPPPKGTRATNIQINDTDAVHLYCTKKELWIQLRRDVPTLEDIGMPSFKVALRLTSEQAVELARELLTAAHHGKTSREVNGPVDVKNQKAESVPSSPATPPSNQGKPWTEEEIKRLCDGHDMGQTVAVLAKGHGRSIGAVEARLIRNGKITPEMLTVYKPTAAAKKKAGS